MNEALAREMLDLAREMESQLDRMVAEMVEMKATMTRIEAKMADCLAIAARAACRPPEQDDARRLH